MTRHILITAILCCPAVAQAIQQRNIEVLTPRSGQRGTTVEVLIEGLDIADPREIVFYRPGIKAIEFEQLPDLERPISLHHRGRVEQQVKCKFVISADCPLGEHPLRLRTATTLTTLATFWVGRFPIVPELECGGNEVRYDGGLLEVIPSKTAVQTPNDTLDTAQEIPLNVTIAGEIKVTSELDRDYYKVRAKKGQRLSVEVDAVRLCDKAYAENEYDLQVRILDGTGRELGFNDDSDLHVQDPILSVLAPANGDYFIEIRQQLFKGGRWIFYRAHIGDFARPLITYPLGGQAGQTIDLQLLGDPAGDSKKAVALPKSLGNFYWFPGEAKRKTPSPLPLRVSPYPNVLENADTSVVAKLPVALNGIISESRQEDVFRFAVKQGKRYRVRVFSRGMGSPLDPTFWIRAAGADQDEIVVDDASWSNRDKPVVPNGLQRPELLDPSIVFTPKQDGEYQLGITDMRGLGGKHFAYRIEIEPAHDVVHTHTVSMANDRFEINRTAGFIVPQGNRWTIKIYVAKGLGNGYNGDLKLVARGLPNGVRMVAPIVPAGIGNVPVQFIADADIKPQSQLFSIDAVATDGTRLATSSQAYVPFINHSGGRAWHHVHLTKYALGITDEAPFSVELEQPSIPLSQSGELKLKVRIRRRKGFDEAIDIQPDWYPNGVSGGGATTIVAGQSEAEYSISASRSATPGTWKMTMNATTTDGLFYSGVGRIRVSSDFIDLAVASPYVALRFQPSAVRRNQSAKVVCDVSHLKPFSKIAKATLLGLPKGVTLVAPLPTLKPDAKQLVFQVKASPTALLGQYRQVRCQLTFLEGGQLIRQLTDNGILRVDPALKKDNR